MQILGTPCGLTMAVKNVGTTVIPAYRWCISEIRTGTEVGATWYGQGATNQNATALAVVQRVRAIPTSAVFGPVITSGQVSPVGVAVSSIRPGQFGLVIVAGIAIAEASAAAVYATEASNYLAIAVDAGNEGKVYTAGAGAAESVVARLVGNSYSVEFGSDYLANGVTTSAKIVVPIHIDPSYVVYETLANL